MTSSTISMISSVVAMVAVLMNQQQAVQAAAAIDLGSCADFAVMGGTAVSFNGVTSGVTVGSVGVSPGTSISGSYVLGSGYAEANTNEAANCAASMLTAYDAAVGSTCTNTATPADLGGVTLNAGVYCNAGGSFLISAGTLTLHGSATDVFIFQAATSITTAASTAVILTGGALASNVFWQAGTTFSTGGSSVVVGTILAGTSITLGGGSVLTGRALAQAAMSCSSGNTVTSFVAGSAPVSSPTTVADVASTGSSSAQQLSNGSIAAVVVMSFIGLLGLMALIYYSITRKSSSEESAESYKKPAGNANEVV